MTEPHDFAQWFVEHLAFVQRVLHAVARRLGIRGDDAEEFVSWATTRLLEDDYALLRKWRGESALRTYLVTVATNLGREFRVQRWGRWRPSAAALRLGPLAVRLETLVRRDGLSVAEAGELLRTRGETTLADAPLARLLAQLPWRAGGGGRGREEREVPIETVADGARPDEALAEREAEGRWQRIRALLYGALALLMPEEQLIVRMHYLQGISLADVARALGVPQKPLYRVKDRALARLAEQLAAAGLTRDELAELLGGMFRDPDGGGHGDDDGPASGTLAQPRDSAASRPSNESCDSSPADEGSGSSDSARSGRSDA